MADRRLTALRAALAFLVITTIGCATSAPAPKTITAKQLAGTWTGFITCYGCAMDFRTMLLIRDDATWTATVLQGNVHHGTLITEGDVVLWGQGARPIGRAIVVEQGGRENLTLGRENGSVWGEFQRVK